MGECPESVDRHGLADVHGRCPWCGRKIEATMSKPAPGSIPVSDLTLAYDYYYDPDYGSQENQTYY